MTSARPTARRASRSEGWSDPAFARVADAVYLVAGLVFPPNRQPAAEAGMRRAMTALRIPDADALARAVDRPGEARDAVLAELTVGETYFFRDANQLDVLGSEILPSLLARRGPQAPLRIWSAGCATGEEPYTLAILLRELGWPHPARILGTDVSRPRLDAARRARYTRWSLRGSSEARTARWFERRASHFQLDPTVRDAVSFEPLNLVADEYPSAATATLEQDVVLCRNVLIYFDMPSVARIATRLLAALAPDGWLILGASDPPLSGLVPCEVVVTRGGIAYRRADRDPARVEHVALAPLAPVARMDPLPAPASWMPLPMPSPEPPARGPAIEPVPQAAAQPASATEPASAAYAASDYAGAETLAREIIQHDAERLDAWILLVRSLANQGQLREADQECVLALDRHRLSPELHYLHAMLLGAAGEHRESANAARRALYLDNRYLMAHMQLGDALARTGDTERASRAFEHVARALTGIGDEEPVPAADGVTATRLRQVAESRLRVLQATRIA